MESGVSLPSSQDLGPSPEPDAFRPYLLILLS